MANTLYNAAKQRLLRAQLDLSSAPLKAALMSSDYTFSAAHSFLNDIDSNVVGTPQPLNNVTTTNGVFDADDVTFPAVAGGSTVGSVVIYNDTGVPGTSLLVAYIDQVVGFPAATNGGDIIIQWDNGAYRIFSL